MEAVRLFRSLDRNQRNTFLACFLGWALDAFDFFLLTFVIVPMADDFGTSIAELTYAITLTLCGVPLGLEIPLTINQAGVATSLAVRVVK